MLKNKMKNQKKIKKEEQTSWKFWKLLSLLFEEKAWVKIKVLESERCIILILSDFRGWRKIEIKLYNQKWDLFFY